MENIVDHKEFQKRKELKKYHQFISSLDDHRLTDETKKFMQELPQKEETMGSLLKRGAMLLEEISNRTDMITRHQIRRLIIVSTN